VHKAMLVYAKLCVCVLKTFLILMGNHVSVASSSSRGGLEISYRSKLRKKPILCIKIMP